MRKAVVLLLLVAAGCGSTARTASPPGGSGPGAQRPAPHGRQPAPGKPDPAAVSVIRAWSSALAKGDVAGAARYFAVPSLLINGPGQDGEPFVTAIRSFSQAVSANAALPCGAQLISAQQRGRYVNALFRLTDRPGQGGGCGRGVGGMARTNFLIRGGRIVEWIRAPSQPGDRPGRSPAAREV